jgi:Uncharacterized protein conserved in bacteria (DUF2188)
MSTRSSFRDALERPDAGSAESPSESTFPMVRLVLVRGSIRQPVEVARLFRKYGMSLPKAHDTLNRLAQGKPIDAEFRTTDPHQLISELSAAGVDARFTTMTKRDARFTTMTKRNEFFIEQRPDGHYNVSRPNADRASAVTGTQAEAIARAREIDPGAAIHVERVRDVGPGRDKWRKI